MAKYDVDLRDYWRIIRRRKTIIIMTVLLISSCSFLFAKFNAPPPLYEATAAIKFERSTSVTGLFIEAISYSSGDPLATQATIITGGPVMEKVAKDMGLIGPELSSEQIRRSKELSQIIANLQNGVTAELITGTNIINITATASDAKTAPRLANTVATVYREQNIAEKNKRIKEARSFIEDQLKSIGGRLKAAEERLKDYKKEKRLVMLDQGVTSAIAAVTDLESQYQKVNRQIEEVSLQLSKLKKEIEPFKMRRVFSEDMSPTISKLNSALLDLIVRRNTLLLNYTQKSPQIQEVESQIKEIKTTLEQTLYSRSETLKKKREILDRQLRRMYEDIPEEHIELARLQREVKVNEDLFSLLRSRYQEALIKEAEQVEEVVIVRSAIEPINPVKSPKILAITLVGLFIGTILGLVVAIVFEGLDTSIGTIEDIEDFLGVPVLGVIGYCRTPEVKEALADKFPKVEDEATLSRYAYLLSHFAPKTHLAESYQLLRTNIQIKFIEQGIKTLLITSSSPLEGKTITSINLALSLAQAGKKVLLVEADIRKPKICRHFCIGGNEPGLVDILLGNYEWREVTKDITDIMLGQMSMKEIMLTPGIDNLNILPSGMRHSSAAEIIGSPKMKDFVYEARQEYDVVLYDSPPVLGSSDCAITATYTDGVLVVYQVGETARSTLKRAKAQLEAVKANVIGVVLNGVKPEISTDYDALKYKYYYYRSNSRDLNGSLSRMLLSHKGLRQKLGKAGEKQGPREKEGIVKKGTFAILILSLVFFTGGISWQYYWGGRTAQSRMPTETEKPQQTLKAEHKTSTKTLSAKEKKTAPSVRKTEKTLPGQARETIRKVQLEKPATEQKSVLRYPYSIHISSYSAQRGALDDLRRLEQKGHRGYLSQVDLGKKGTWHRVFIGPFENQKAAKEYLGNLEEFRGAGVLSTPFALELASFGSQEEAIEEQRRLSRGEYVSTYILRTQVPHRDGVRFRLLTGAFCSKEEAETFLHTLQKDGLEAQVVVR